MLCLVAQGQPFYVEVRINQRVRMKNKALLLDRDGVINVDHGYVGTIDRFNFMPAIFPFLRMLRDHGFRLAILTNQSGVARGNYSEADYATLTTHMLSSLKNEGISIDLTLACFEHPEGLVTSYKHESFWRKPNPGMVLEAVRRLDLAPLRCAFLGDSLRDMEAAQGGGIKKCLWLSSKNAAPPSYVTVVRDYNEALKLLL